MVLVILFEGMLWLRKMIFFCVSRVLVRMMIGWVVGLLVVR